MNIMDISDDMIGTEPQLSAISVYHAAKIAPSVPLGQRTDDLYIKDRKVVVLGIDEDGNEEELPPGPISGSQKGTEFLFSEAYDNEAQPSALTQTVLQPLGQAAVRGINGLLLLLGQTGSGKTEMMHGTETNQGERGWGGVVEKVLEALYASMPSDSISAAEDMYSVRMQFLSIVHERVQDLLQPNCHAHDLELVERTGTGIEVVGADTVEISGLDAGMRLYAKARDELRRLHRYHNVDPSSQTTVVRITLRRRGKLRDGALLASPAGSVAADASQLTGAVVSQITIVELPGTERLAVDRSMLHVSEDPLVHRSITQFAQMVDELASRSGAEHVSWKGGKLTTLLSDRLGVNACVRCIATVRAGAPKVSLATLQCAAKLAKVASYPVVNSAAAVGLRTISQSEVLALRSDLRTLANKGALRGKSDDSSKWPGVQGGLLTTPFGEVPGGLKGLAEGLAGGGGGGYPRGEMTAEQQLAESALQGKLIEGEMERKMLKEQRLQAVQEKAELQKQYSALLEEKQEAERLLLEAEREKLKAAKALIDLDLESTVNKSVKEGREIELEGALLKAEGEKKALAEEGEELRTVVGELEKELRTSQNEKEDLLRELLAARNSLEKQRQQGQSLLSDARERDLEIVRSVKQAEQFGEQLDAQGKALSVAREETEKVKSERHQAEARVTTLEAEVAALRREAATAKAQREELLMAKRKAEVQKDLFEVYMKRERGELALERQRLKDTLLEGEREARDKANKEAAAEKAQGDRVARQLVEARAELTTLKERLLQLEERNGELEETVDDGERRLQKANESFRETLSEAIAVQIGKSTGGGEAGKENEGAAGANGTGGGAFATALHDGMGKAEAAVEASAAGLLEALRGAYEAHEAHLRTRLDKLQRRLWNTLEMQRQKAAAEQSAKQARAGQSRAQTPLAVAGADRSQTPGGDAGRTSPGSEKAERAQTPGNAAVTQVVAKSLAEQEADRKAAREAIAAAGEEAARSALQEEGRAVLQAYVEEAAQLRMERGTLRGQLEAAAVQAKFAANMYMEERAKLQRELDAEKVRAEAALTKLHETGGENASVKLQREGVASRHAQQGLLTQLDAIKEHREQLVRLKEQEREETGSTFEEVRIMRAELMALRKEIAERLTKDPRKVANLRMQIKNFHITCAELERERTNWMRRATAAEMQLDTLQETLGDNLAKYQRSLLKIRKQMRKEGLSDAAIQQAAEEDGIPLPPPSPEPPRDGGAGSARGSARSGDGDGAAPPAPADESAAGADAPAPAGAPAPASIDRE